jgi:DNA-binding SARP family transcriptional activator
VYRILGPVEVELEGPPLSVKGKKPRALLALLILRRNEPVPTELLIESLWGDRAPATAANTLQVYVSQLRKIVGDRVSREGGAYRLRTDPDELDAERFERLAEEGDAALRRRSFREAAELLAEALGLWRGPALADLRYESFAQGEIARLEELRLVANENRIESELAGRRTR